MWGPETSCRYFKLISLAILLSSCDSALFNSTSENTTQNTTNDANQIPIVIGPILTPGEGFSGPTQEPGQIGSGTAKVIARWDVVPYQTIGADGIDRETFNVGVVAFHINGIDRIEISVEGGPFTTVNSMGLNTQTNVVEYFATLERSAFNQDKAIEIRAIAYPKATKPQSQGTGDYAGGGYPRLLEPLYLYVDAGDLQTPTVAYVAPTGNDTATCGTSANPCQTPFRGAQRIAEQNSGSANGSADGGIVYLDAGNYTLIDAGAKPNTTNRWLTLRAKPGVSRSQVNITSATYPGFGIDKLKLEEVTLRKYVDGSAIYNSIWLNQVTCQGEGIQIVDHWAGWNPGWESTYWTGVNVFDSEQSAPGHIKIMRDSHAQRVQKAMLNPQLVINSTWQDTAPYNNAHTTFVAWNVGTGNHVENTIIYGVTGKNLNSGGFFFKTADYLKDIAIVNVAYDLVGAQPSSLGESCNAIEHFLMYNTSHLHAWIWQLPQAHMTNMSIRGNYFDIMGIDQQRGGDTLNDLWFDQNHFNVAPPAYGSLVAGSNYTIGDPLFSDTFTPSVNSPLRHRLNHLLSPADAYNQWRSIPATIGAVE